MHVDQLSKMNNTHHNNIIIAGKFHQEKVFALNELATCSLWQKVIFFVVLMTL